MTAHWESASKPYRCFADVFNEVHSLICTIYFQLELEYRLEQERATGEGMPENTR